MRLFKLCAVLALSVPSVVFANGSSPAPSYTLASSSYSQDFNSLASSGTSTSLPAGFQIVEQGSGGSADGAYAAGTGSSNAGNAYSFGATGSSDRALGSVASGGVSPVYFGAVFTNGLGGTVTDLAFDYSGELWRYGGTAGNGDKLMFQFSTDATGLDNGTWTDFSSLDYMPDTTGFSSAGAVDGNVFTSSISGTISGLSIADGQSFGFRWVDLNSAGNDLGLGVDDLNINATLGGVAAVPEPATWALMILGFGFVGGALRRRQQVSLRLA